MPYLKPATLEEAIALSQDLSPEDEAEIRAMSGHEPVVSDRGWDVHAAPQTRHG